jgi:RND family efflux transporter MFP subunit
LVIGTVAIVAIGGLLFTFTTAHANRVAVSDSAKPVTVVPVRASEYRATHRYVGAIQAWVAASVGPQLVSAYVESVLVRPGAMVKKNQVVATLDCRHATTGSKAMAMQALSLEAQQRAIADEAARVSELLDGGFVSPNEAEQKKAETASKSASLLAARADLARASLDVGDCVLRAPFDGEVFERLADPGFFARPGTSVVTVVDRATVRITAEVPEDDSDAVAPGTPVTIHSQSTGETFVSRIARRAPSAEPSTRTIHVEVDVPNPERKLPVETTAELRVEVGKAVPASAVPLRCASVRGRDATVFVVDQGVAHKRVIGVVGESGGTLYLDRALGAGSLVVAEGRMLLKDGDRVNAAIADDQSSRGPAASAATSPPEHPEHDASGAK